MLGQAALESGWGKREIKGTDGKTSHNLSASRPAGLEGQDGHRHHHRIRQRQGRQSRSRNSAPTTAMPTVSGLRQLLASNPRYQKVLASGGDASSFAQGLQRAGYATDPQYASKLTSIIKHSLA